VAAGQVRHQLLVLAALAAAAQVSAPALAKATTEWDGLVHVKSKRLKAVFLLPGADFRDYTKVIIDPPESAFRKDWVRDFNRDSRNAGSRITDQKAAEVLASVNSGFAEILAEEFGKGGYEVVTAPGPDVLRIRTGVVDLDVKAPEPNGAGRVNVYSEEAGEATLIIEARDSLTNALLGRGVEARVAGYNNIYLRNRGTNRRDFELLFREWARASVQGLATLKDISPVDTNAIAKRKR
jgi:hypothetical protein